jgi:hypothetical protein
MDAPQWQRVQLFLSIFQMLEPGIEHALYAQQHFGLRACQRIARKFRANNAPRIPIAR